MSGITFLDSPPGGAGGWGGVLVMRELRNLTRRRCPLPAASSARCPADDGVKRGGGGVEGVRRERDHASEVLFICAITAEGCGNRIYPMRKSNVLSKSTVRVI